MQFEIRKARSQDEDEVYGLVRNFAVSFQPDRITFSHSFKRLILEESARVLVAVSQKTIVGYLLGFTHLTFFANGSVGWIEEIMVDETFRRQGIARALTMDFEQWVTSRGGKLVALATRRASDFYRSIGYEESAIYFRKEFTSREVEQTEGSSS